MIGSMKVMSTVLLNAPCSHSWASRWNINVALPVKAKPDSSSPNWKLLAVATACA
ncbi:hypothetical protein D3C71_2114960 [compost metagenome]